MGVSGGSGVFRRFREACSKWPLSRSTSARDGKGAVIFASTDEVLALVYRPNLTVRDVCTQAALKVNISPVALDFFTLVSEDGNLYLNPDKMLCEAECSQVYMFKLCIKACHGMELRDFDRHAMEYYFHQCREDFLRGKVGEFGSNQTDFAKVVLYEIAFRARQRGVHPKVIIDKPGRYGIKCLFQRGVFKPYPIEETKTFLKDNIPAYENLRVDQIESQLIASLERADDFFVHKLSFEKIYIVDNVSSQRKFEILVSAEFGIKKRRTDVERSLPEDIVKEFSEVEALEFDHMMNQVTIIRKNCVPEVLRASSPQAAYSLITLIQGYYRLMVNQYKQLLRGPKRTGAVLCHGPISRDKAENILKKGSKEDGSFLLRRRRNDHFGHVLSVYTAKEVRHYVIKQDTSDEHRTFHLETDVTNRFLSLLELVEHYKQEQGGLPICLSKICLPKTEGLSALLDREVMTPALPVFQLIDPAIKISLEDLIFETDSLSRGEFGEVKKGSWWCPGAEGLVLDVAFRALVKPIGREKINEFKKNMSSFLELKNQHLTQFHGIAENEKALFFVFEFAGEGPLDAYIKKEASKMKYGITKGRVVSYAAQIAEGMMFLHSQKCVHGRLSAHNVLVASEECVKISDYGLLNFVKSGQSFHASRNGYGYSYCWFAPLSLQHHTFNLKSDVWSFGVTLWEMFTMKKPFHGSFADVVLTEEQVLSRYLKGQYLNPDRPSIPAKVAALMKTCFAPEPEDRMTFEDLVIQLRSNELFPEDEAEEFLLPPDITNLEDWEIPLPPQKHEMELQKRRANSRVSNVDYSCLPGNVPQDDSSDNGDSHNLPGITMIPSTSLFNNTDLRKPSLSKTFSHPGLTIRSSETEGSSLARDPVSALAGRKASITRASSCPPAIEVTTDRPQERSEPLTMETTENQQEVRYGQAPMPSFRENDQARNADVELLRPPSLTQLGLLVFGTGSESTVDASSEELEDGEENSNDDDDDGHRTEVGAEALAMRSLGGLVKTSVVPAPSSVTDLYRCDEESSNEESKEQLTKLGSSSYINLNTKVMSPAGFVSGSVMHSSSSTDDVDHSNGENSSGECNEQLSKLSSSSYIHLNTAAISPAGFGSGSVTHPSTSPDDLNDDEESNSEVINELLPERGLFSYISLVATASTSSASISPQPANYTGKETEKLRSGSYVTLAATPRSSEPQDTAKESVILQDPTVHSTVEDYLAFGVSLVESSLSNIGAANSNSSHPNSQNSLQPHRPNVEQQIPGTVYVSSDETQTSPYQSHSEMKKASPLKGLGFPCKSPEELLASFSNVKLRSGIDLDAFLSHGEDGSLREDSSSLITDLRDDSDGGDTESSREDAEASLGKMFHSGFNRIQIDNVETGSTLDPVHHLRNFLEFKLDTMSEQPPSVLQDDTRSQVNVPAPSDIDVGNENLFRGLVGSDEVDIHDEQPESPLSWENQEVFSSPNFEHDAFLSNIASVSSAPIVPVFECNPFGPVTSADTGEESEPEADDDNDDTFDNEMDMSCGHFGFSPGKANFLNSPILMFDQGHETIEMKEFSLNNLSRESLKSTEPLFFKDNQSASQGMNLNQLDGTFSGDGCTLDDEQEASDVEGNAFANPSSYSFTAAVGGQLKEITRSTPGTSRGGGYIPMKGSDCRASPEQEGQQPTASLDIHGEAQPVNSGNVGNGYCATPAPGAQDPSVRSSDPVGNGYCATPAPVAQDSSVFSSDSSSSDGVWPCSNAAGGIVKRKSTSGSLSSSGDVPPTIELDMSTIPSKLQIPFEQLQIQDALGRGQFGEVRKANIVYTDYSKTPKREDVAVKVLKTNASQRDSSDFVKEVQNMIVLESKQQCDYIIKLRGVCKDPKGKLMLVTELAPLGALCNYLKDPKNKEILGTSQLLDFCMQICKGMRYLEDQSLLHRDLAARNILVMREDLVKISDFGLSRLQDYYRLQETNEKRYLPVKWYALESLLHSRFTTKSDVWSFGVTMWEIFSYGDEPYKDYKKCELYIKFLQEGNRLVCPDKCPQKVYEVMQSCWLKDAIKRPSFYWLETTYLKKCCSDQQRSTQLWC